MSKDINVTGPDSLELAVASVRFGDDAMVSFYAKNDGRYDFFVRSVVKNGDFGKITLSGQAGRWVHVPMGYGESRREPLSRATVKYDLNSKKGVLTFCS